MRNVRSYANMNIFHFYNLKTVRKLENDFKIVYVSLMTQIWRNPALFLHIPFSFKLLDDIIVLVSMMLLRIYELTQNLCRSTVL